MYPYGKQCYLSGLEFFHCLPPLFHCLPLWTTVRLHGKKLQNATKHVIVLGHENLMPLHTLHQSRGKSGHTKTRTGMRKTCDRVRAWKPHGLTKSTSNQLRFFQISSKVTKTSDKMQVVASNHRGDWYARRCTKIFRYLNPIPTRGKEEILPTI